MKEEAKANFKEVMGQRKLIAKAITEGLGATVTFNAETFGLSVNWDAETETIDIEETTTEESTQQ